jgi:hypothetical protein
MMEKQSIRLSQEEVEVFYSPNEEALSMLTDTK